MLRVLFCVALLCVAAVVTTAQAPQSRHVRGRVKAAHVVLEATEIGTLPVTVAVIGDETIRVRGGRWGGLTLGVSELPQIRVGDDVALEVVNGHARRGTVIDQGLSDGAVLGPKWIVAEVPYYVDPSNADVSPNAALAAIRWAADVWATEARPSIRMVYAGPTSGAIAQFNAKNEVFFSPENNGGTIAVSYYWWNGANEIVDSDIVFYDGGFRFFTGSSGCESGMYLEDPAVHEFGHTLGLAHSAIGEATMYPTLGWCSQAWRSLAVDDVVTIHGLYPPIVAVPLSPLNLRIVR